MTDEEICKICGWEADSCNKNCLILRVSRRTTMAQEQETLKRVGEFLDGLRMVNKERKISF